MKRLLSCIPLLLSTMAIGPCSGRRLGNLDAGPSRDAEPDAGATACRGSLAEVGRNCPATFNGTAVQLPACSFGVQIVRSCGDLISLEPGASYYGAICYFDSTSYSLVGAREFTDVGNSYCGNSFSRTAGRIPESSCNTILENECQPIDAASDAGKCAYGGTVYDVGQRFPSSDGCNTCLCGGDGSIACTEIWCPMDGGADRDAVGTGTGGAGGGIGDGGGGGAGGGADAGCPGTRITEAQALLEYTAFVNPDPSNTITVLELEVPNLWEVLNIQVFKHARSSSTTTLSRGSFVYHSCAIRLFATESAGSGVLSGFVRGTAFYYSYAWGSGVFRSHLGRITVVGSTLTIVETGGYTRNSAPPPLMVRPTDSAMVVEFGTPGGFNVWTNPMPFGTLLDLGDRLTVIDAAGQEIPPTF